MLLLVVIIAVIPALICGVVLVAREVRARRPEELRGDWWPEFERQFRAYAGQHGSHHRRRSQLRAAWVAHHHG
jgi:hypothetical protein